MMGTYRNELSKLLAIAGPIIVTQLLFMGIDITDTIMAGLMGEKEIACVATASSFFLPIMLFVIGVKMVLSPLVSTALGEHRFSDIDTDVSHMILVGLLFSIPVFLVFYFNLPFFQAIGINPEILELTSSFLSWKSWGIFPLLLFSSYRYFYEGIGVTLPIMYALVIGFVSNIIFNYCFMFGVGPFPPLGIHGLALSTVFVDTFLFLSLFFFQRFTRHIHSLKLIFHFQFRRMLEILKLGVPSGVLVALEVMLFTVIGLLLARTSIDEIASHQVALNISAFVYMVPLGLAGALASRVGFLRGKGDYVALRYCIKIGIVSISLFMISVSVLLYFYRFQIPLIFHVSEPVLVKIAGLLSIVVGYQLFDGIQVVVNGILKGFKDTLFSMISGLISFWGVGFLPGYYLAMIHGLGVYGFWIGILMGLIVASLLFSLRLWWQLRRLST